LNALSYIEVDQEAIRHNLRALKSLCRPGIQVCAVVKANAYGHGLELVARAIERDIDLFAIDDIEELRALRMVSNKRAMVLGFVPKGSLEEAFALDAEIGVYDVDRINILQSIAQKHGTKAKVHLKIDALLGRQGVLPGQATEMARAIAESPNLELISAYSHFGNIEDTTDLTHSQLQSEAFAVALAELRSISRAPIARHESATSGAMAREPGQSDNDMVRLGIGLYGLYPSQALSRSFSQLRLKPTMRWVSHLAQVKELPAHHPIGYGLTFITSRPTVIGIVPQGYSDGYDRGLSSAGDVLVNGSRCAVLGRIAMNMFAIDLTGVPNAKAEDEVVLLGKSGDEEITAEELALRIGTINYEIVARVSPILPRIAK
jgi:alanine racemase